MDTTLVEVIAAPIIVGIFFSCIMLYPFYLKKYKPPKYRGAWRDLGEIYKTPLEALKTPIGLAIGLIIANLLVRCTPPIYKKIMDTVIKTIAIVMVIMAIIIVKRREISSKKLKELETRHPNEPHP